MSKYEEERLCDLLEVVTEAWRRAMRDYEQSQGMLYKTQERLRDAKALTDGLEWQVQELESENTKLRENIRELYECSRQCGCDRCAYRDQCALLARIRDMEVGTT